MEEMKQEILAVISKYVSVDSDNVDIALQKRERDSLLVAEIPFLKTLEGIERGRLRTTRHLCREQPAE